MATVPANGSPLTFGAGTNGYTLVGQSTMAILQIKNTTTGTTRGGFAGSFPSINGEFKSPATSLVIAGKNGNGYLTPGMTDQRTYSYTPTGRGADTLPVTFTPTGGYSGTPPSSQVTFTGQGVAPVVNLDQSLINAGNVRIGTSGIAKVVVNNGGDGNLSGLGSVSNLKGSIPALTGVFTASSASIDLADNGTQNFQAAFTPTSHGLVQNNFNVSTTNGNANGTNTAQTLPVTFSGTGVGPTFGSSITPGSTIDFGSVAGASSQKPLVLSNATLDNDLGALTNLTLLSANFTGADASMFSLPSFAPNTLLSKGGSLNLNINFANSGAPGVHTAMLTFATDQNAALGGSGGTFSYQLTATAVPEPSILLLLATAIGGLNGWRLLRRRSVR